MSSKNYSGTGGGFLTDMPSQVANSSPIKNRVGGNLSQQTLKPATIKQLNDAVLTTPESPFQMDGHDLTQVTVVACVRTIKEQNNGSDYLLEDGTGSICGHFWVNDKNGSPDWMRSVREGEWVRVFGALKVMGQNRYLNVNLIRALSSSDELTYHFLGVTALHLSNTGRDLGKAPVASNPAGMATFSTNASVSSSFSPIQQAVQGLYRQCTVDAGLHVNSVIQALRSKYAEPDVRNAINWLMNEGYLYQTIDNDHAKSTE